MTRNKDFVFCPFEGVYCKVGSPCGHLIKIGFGSGSNPLFFSEKYFESMRKKSDIDSSYSLDGFCGDIDE